jgi:methyl-accepting chemotaxis protein
MTEMFNFLEELNQQRLTGAFETEAEYEEERAKLVQYYQEKLTQYSELYGISLTTDAKVVADAWSTTFMQTSVPMGEMNTAIQEYLKETDKLFANWTEIGTAAEKIFGSSMDNSKTKVNNVVSAVDELANKLGGDNGVIDKVG